MAVPQAWEAASSPSPAASGAAFAKSAYASCHILRDAFAATASSTSGHGPGRTMSTRTWFTGSNDPSGSPPSLCASPARPGGGETSAARSPSAVTRPYGSTSASDRSSARLSGRSCAVTCEAIHRRWASSRRIRGTIDSA
ncbi:hypothetical protein O1L68_14920 [Streptomyces lydicus]|nr:hypothetical protein [Streptomyces lydicus]